jgi:membrane-bound lytic murein transglycosylase D
MTSGPKKVYFMKKFYSYSSVLVSTFFLLSCSQLKKDTVKSSQVPAPSLPSLSKSDEVQKLESAPKRKVSRENTHELVDVVVPDTDIKREVGEAELDDDDSTDSATVIPYSKKFLTPKQTKRMKFWVEYFTKNQRERFQRFINNGEEYRHHIEQVMMEYGLPKELYFVGLIESGYYLGAKSHASAVGPWQFIKATGKRYGLKINHELDERKDLFKASHAAAQYFKDLYNIFSSWELALAAYNAGENGMIRRIMRYGSRDFYQLSKNKQLPSETINYVPKVLAAMYVVNNAEKYGFVIPKKTHRLFDRTQLKPVQRGTPLSALAKRLNVEPALLVKLNPELKRSVTPRYYPGNYYLRVPENSYAYSLESSENTLTSLKARDPSKKITRPGSRKELVRRLARAPSPRVKLTNKPIVYKVGRGDNLHEIARLFNTPVSKIKRANNLRRGKILAGQKLILPDTQKAIYTVKKGDHLTKVAKDFNLPTEALVKLNSLKKRTIYPGQKIIVTAD